MPPAARAAFFLLVLLSPIAAAAAAERADYAVVVSKTTRGDGDWAKVVDALTAGRRAEVIVYDREVKEAVPGLRKLLPRHACFVAQPEELGRQFVIDVHRLTRTLDDDPYTDVLWGIVTGYSAKEALRIAECRQPLVIRRAAAGTSLDLGLFDEGIWFSEGQRGVRVEKKPGNAPERKKGPDDSTQAIVAALNTLQPQLFLTSGHATERDWQLGYSYRNGQFRSKDGVLFGLDLEGRRHPIHTAEPKVYLPSGNCLIGLVRDRQAMALAWMGSGGANQMIGYVVPTWYGRGGWGTRDWLFHEPGRRSLSEAFYFNNQMIVHALVTRFPKAAGMAFADYERMGVGRELAKIIADLKAAKREGDAKDLMGLLWDRDTVAFYGDPAWDARLAPRELPFDQELKIAGGVYTLELRAKQDCRAGVPPAALLPHRIEDIDLLEGQDFAPLVTDDFVILAKPPAMEAGKTYRLVFRAKVVE